MASARPTISPKEYQQDREARQESDGMGCFCDGGLGKLFRINGIMRKEDYHIILMLQMIPSADALIPGIPSIFQQDNDLKHTAKVCKAYLVNKAINTLDWPVQSPDLNQLRTFGTSWIRTSRIPSLQH
jgi:hypothetical protein